MEKRRSKVEATKQPNDGVYWDQTIGRASRPSLPVPGTTRRDQAALDISQSTLYRRFGSE